jgi:hypothetical protein
MCPKALSSRNPKEIFLFILITQDPTYVFKVFLPCYAEYRYVVNV